MSWRILRPALQWGVPMAAKDFSFLSVSCNPLESMDFAGNHEILWKEQISSKILKSSTKRWYLKTFSTAEYVHISRISKNPPQSTYHRFFWKAPQNMNIMKTSIISRNIIPEPWSIFPLFWVAAFEVSSCTTCCTDHARIPSQTRT